MKKNLIIFVGFTFFALYFGLICILFSHPGEARITCPALLLYGLALLLMAYGWKAGVEKTGEIYLYITFGALNMLALLWQGLQVWGPWFMDAGIFGILYAMFLCYIVFAG
jgi:hypothetical protein